MLPVVTQPVCDKVKAPALLIEIVAGISVYDLERPINDHVPVTPVEVDGMSYID